MLKTGDKKIQAEVDLLDRLKAAFDDGKPARSVEMTNDEREILKSFPLLSAKPVLYAANVREDEVATGSDNALVQKVKEKAAQEEAEVVVICAKIEAEIAELEDEEKQLFLTDIGLSESGLDRLIRAAFHLLGLMTYFTAGVQEVRAWTIKQGTKAPQAAGVIHTDFERGFIRAEIVGFVDLTTSGSQNAAKEKGLVRLEGKEYVMQDGDVVHFRFNV
jgi:ribosome-binding ATPase